MKTRDFFRLFIKLFGLYFLLQIIFYFFPTNIYYYGSGTMMIIFYLAILLIVLGIFMWMLKNSDRMIDWLNLDKGFESDEINFGSLDEQKLFSLAIIFIGGFLLVDYIPTFLYNCFMSFSEIANNSGLNGMISGYQAGFSFFDLVLSALNLILGYVMIMYHKVISSWLTNR